MDQHVTDGLRPYQRQILGVIFAASFVIGIAWSDNHPDLQGIKVVVATENATPPLQYIDPLSGDPIGWEHDFIQELANRLNFELVIENIAWDDMLLAVSEGQYDVGMTGITIRDDHREKVDFSISYMRSEMYMLTRAEEDRFNNTTEFAAIGDALIGAQAGTTAFDTAVHEVLDGDETSPRIIRFHSFRSSIQALKTGEVDLVLIDGTAGQGLISANQGVFKLIGNAIGSEDFGLIFPKSSNLAVPFNAGIDSMLTDGTLDALDKRWFLDDPLGQ